MRQLLLRHTGRAPARHHASQMSNSGWDKVFVKCVGIQLLNVLLALGSQAGRDDGAEVEDVGLRAVAEDAFPVLSEAGGGG